MCTFLHTNIILLYFVYDNFWLVLYLTIIRTISTRLVTVRLTNLIKHWYFIPYYYTGNGNSCRPEHLSVTSPHWEKCRFSMLHAERLGMDKILINIHNVATVTHRNCDRLNLNSLEMCHSLHNNVMQTRLGLTSLFDCN